MGDVLQFRPLKPEKDPGEVINALQSAEYWLTELIDDFDEGTVDRVALKRAFDCVSAVHEGYLTTLELKSHGITTDRTYHPEE